MWSEIMFEKIIFFYAKLLTWILGVSVVPLNNSIDFTSFGSILIFMKKVSCLFSMGICGALSFYLCETDIYTHNSVRIFEQRISI